MARVMAAPSELSPDGATLFAVVKPGPKGAQILTAIRRVLWNKGTLAVVCVAAGLWAAGCGLIYSQMRKPPEQFGRFMMKVPAPVVFLGFPFETMWMHARAGALNLGDRAPDFTLTRVDQSGPVRLSELNRTQPVVLIFGSYT